MATEPNKGLPTTTQNRSKIVRYLLSHKLVMTLLIVLLGVTSGAMIKMALLKNNYEKKIKVLETNFQQQTDSLNLKHFELLTKTLSWAVRSELMRENKDQANQFLATLVKEKGVVKILFIDAVTSKIILATDKKDEGTMFTQQFILLSNTLVHTSENTLQTFYCPVMGLNLKLGILAIEFDTKIK